MHTVVVTDLKTLDLDAGMDGFAPDVDVRQRAVREPEAVIEAATGADGLIVDAGTRVTRTVLERTDLSVVGRAGIGVDNVDVTAAEELGVAVVHVPDYCLDEVSTHAVGLALACLRRIGRYDRSVRGGGWDWAIGRPVPRLAGSTVGLVAFGDIARRVAAKFRGFDVDVLAYDPYVSAEHMAAEGVEKVDFPDLLARADLCSIHAPLTEETRGLFDVDAFAAMRDDAVLVNTARGPIVDEDALHDALVDGELAAAGLDVREEEPPGDSPLHALDDVLLTPHVAWYSEASRRDLTHTIVADVQRVLDGKQPENPVELDTGWF